TNTGFSLDQNFFTSTGIDNAPLRALRSGVDGPNGVYTYAGSPQFPAQSYLNANYWVDVTFSPAPGTITMFSVTPNTTTTVYQKQTLKFTATQPVTWSLAPGSQGTIDPDGTYHAPSKIISP